MLQTITMRVLNNKALPWNFYSKLSLEGLKTPGLVLSTAVLARGTGILPSLFPARKYTRI